MPFRLTPVVLNLIIINVLVFLALNIYQDEWFTSIFLLFKSDLVWDRPYGGFDLFKPYQIVTSFFAHVDVMHILFNMLALSSFGTALESMSGSKRFLQEYLIYGVGAGILIALFDPSFMPVLGASTAISGILVSFAMRWPDAPISIFLLPISFKAIHFVIGLAVISGGIVAYGIATGEDTGRVSHFGHFAGMAVAFAYLYGEQWLRRAQRRR